MNTGKALLLLTSLCLTACAQTAATQVPTATPVATSATLIIEPTITIATLDITPGATTIAIASSTFPPATSLPPATISATPNLIPPTAAIQSADCDVLPQAAFLTVWQNNSDLKTSLGCLISNHPRITPRAWEVQTSYQAFENGMMLWSDHSGWFEQPVIYVIYADGTYERFDDTFDAAVDPATTDEQAPNERFAPSYGFGKLWREQTRVHDALGWATAGEIAGDGRFQLFNGGDMIWLDQTGRVYAFSLGVAHTFEFPVFE